MSTSFSRIAIVNRGEAAMRLIHAARESGREGQPELRTIALFTEPDRHAMFVREADEALCLGPAMALDAEGKRRSSYLDLELLERALGECRAEAAWVGWGFVAERPEFAELCGRMGIAFVGPDPEVMRRLGDKIGSKRLAEQVRIPLAPWSGGPVESLAEAREHARRIGFPLMIKATAGGGGRGIRKVQSVEELGVAFERARDEARAAFGDPTVFLERALGGTRHVEVQVIADRHGSVHALGTRDCTIQRRHQKLIEESASPVLDPGQVAELEAAAIRLCAAAGYVNAGTVEFLYEVATRSFAFLEVNTRLQVEHPVTELTTDVDLVKLQLLVARGGRLPEVPPARHGHAIEARINAEDPERGFAPAPGRIELLRLPTGPGVRVDTGFEERDPIPAEFDSMIAKVIARGANREEALARLRRALAQCTIVVHGGGTNREYLLELLGRPETVDGTADVSWLDREPFAAGRRKAHPELALLQAAIEVHDAELEGERQVFMASAARGRPRFSAAIGRTVELRHAGATYRVEVHERGERQYDAVVDGARIALVAERLGPFERRLQCDGRVHRVLAVPNGVDYEIAIDGATHRVSRDDNGVVRSPAPAVVVALKVRPGEEVAQGQTVAVLEAMKMEMHVAAPFAGRVRDVLAATNEQVDAGAPLLRLKPLAEAGETASRERLGFSALEARPAAEEPPLQRCTRVLEQLRALVLGFDVDPATAERLVAERQQAEERLDPADPQLLAGEDRLLRSFLDVHALSQRQPEVEDEIGATGRSPRESLVTFLRAAEAGGEGLSERFLGNLRRALQHYDVQDLQRSPRLEQALLRIYKSHSHAEHQVVAVMSLLQRRLEHAERLGALATEEQRALLDALVQVSNRRFPSLEDLAREVRYELFDKPLFEESRREVYARIDGQLERLGRETDERARANLVAELVDCPQPLMNLLSRRYAEADGPTRRRIVEIVTRRYYRIRDLRDLRVVEAAGHAVASATYELEGRRVRVCATFADFAELEAAARAVDGMLPPPDDREDVVVDFYVRPPAVRPEAEALCRAVEQAIDGAGFRRKLRRVVVCVTAPEATLRRGGRDYFTLRPSGAGYREEPLYRGLHPMIGKRLHIWRLRDFQLERLPSVEDVYLFRGVSRENAEDERLFALAEVRDVTPLRDEHGRIAALPHLERLLLECFAAIRVFQSRRPPQKRLYWNRVMLYVWPLFALSTREVAGIVRRLAPAATGLGLEKVIVQVQVRSGNGEAREIALHISNPARRGVEIHAYPPSDRPIRSVSPYRQQAVKLRQLGLIGPYEIVRLLTPSPGDSPRAALPPGQFVEYDLDPSGRLARVAREPGGNTANVVVGVVRNFTDKAPEGLARVIVLGDPSRSLGSLAEPECRRILAALDLAERLGVPLEWFAVSAGARISMDSGTENMDWIARVLRRIVRFTQGGGEINVVVHGVNVGAQPYWNAEATMLMHTRGILIMTHDGAMVLTGKRALDYSGSVSAEDNFGIGGYDRIMGPNGQAQYYAPGIDDACRLLLRYYDHAYVMPGERFPRRRATGDPLERDVRESPYDASDGSAFQSIGDIFSDETNPGRKKPFDIRRVMRAVIDRESDPLERWSGMRDAEVAVVWDACLGGRPVCLVGLESRPLTRAGFVPADGPEQWSAGTLFPQSSRKVARAINAASGGRPLVVLANLSGFDGSPEAMRNWQLEYGAEIGRAVVNFDGPIVFCVICRYHGGAFVVFSQALNENMEVAALEGAYASVIGGAPAAAVVFSRDVVARTRSDPRIQELETRLRVASGAARGRLGTRLRELYREVHAEKLGEVAEQFDRVHSVHRALEVGSVHRIVPPSALRPYLIGAVERGIARELRRKPEARTAVDWERRLAAL